MSTGSERERALQLLRTDPLRHIVGLKMIERLGERVALRRAESERGWAMLLLFDSQQFEYDARTYAGRRIAVLEGSSQTLAIELLSELPNTPLVLKTQLPAVQRRAIEALGARSVAAFESFTASATFETPSTAAMPTTSPWVRSATALTAEIASVFERNDYGAPELASYFARGARWFTLERDGAVAAACFVFCNYGPVWEVAGVHTAPEFRRQGLASEVVRAAIAHLLGEGLLPRYQVSVSNVPSVELARRLGLTPFLRMEHLLLSPAG